MLGLALLSLSSLARAITVSIPLTAPSGAPSISPSLVSFSIEQDRWTDWVGTTSRNEFFFNALDNIANISGEVPHIRIGADSEDRTNFNANLGAETQLQFPAPTVPLPYPEASTVVVGNGFYQAAQFLPPNIHVTWGVNFGEDNLTATFLETQSIVKAFSSPAIKDAGIMLDFIEIGNEADAYGSNGFRNASQWNISEYVKEWIAFATNVSTTAGLPNTSTTKFWGGAFSGTSHSATGFSPQGLFSNGILFSAPGSLITTISQHLYSGAACNGDTLLITTVQNLMNKTSIRGNLSILSPDISATKAQGLDYVLGETNSYSCHGAANVSDTAGAALWALDYALFANQLGISRLFFHEGVGFKYNFLQPITLTRSINDGSNLTTPLPPHIQPPYYAAIIAAEAIGNSGNTQATEIQINDTRISGYAFFDGGQLARAVFINSKAFLPGDANRTSVHIDFSIAGSTPPTNMTIKRLDIGHADDTSGVTWGGQSYETADARVNGTLVTYTVSVAEGLDIQETEVVLLMFA